MTEHHAHIRWRRESKGFAYAEYNRRHEWAFDGGHVVPASSAPEFRGDPACVDPEEAYVAALSSCHMLWFLHLASVDGHVVDAYEDRAVGVMEKAADGRPWVSRVTLRPEITFAPGTAPDAEKLADLHERAHDNCFVARSVRTEVVVERESE